MSSDTFLLGLPHGYSSWAEVPANPLIGIRATQQQSGGAASTSQYSDSGAILGRDDFRHWCDACQRGYNSDVAFAAHQEQHLKCEVPGCNFTCKKDKPWKMDFHMETLHSRLDAPNLADPRRYLADRRAKFPTAESVATKKEELTLRASRGEVLPDERRRWLRRFGVTIYSRDGHNIIKEHEESKNDTPEMAAAKQKAAQEKQERKEARLRRVAIQIAARMQREEQISNSSISNDDGQHAVSRRVVTTATHQQLIPMGAYGRLTKSQQVQIVRDRYRAASRVPTFYICNKCGSKGQHWIEDCPTITSATTAAAAAAYVPSPLKQEQQQQEQQPVGVIVSKVADEQQQQRQQQQSLEKEKSASPARSGSASSSASSSSSWSSGASSCAEDYGIRPRKEEKKNEQQPAPKRPPPPRDEDRPLTEFEETQRRRLIARRRLRDKESALAISRAAAAGSGGAAMPTVSLLDRMMEDSKLAQRGLLLQAMHFFKAANFFEEGGSEEEQAQNEEDDEDGEEDNNNDDGEETFI